MRAKIRAVVLVILAAGAMVAQSPIQVQGRDYAANIPHVLNTDSKGVLNVNATVSGAGGCPGTLGTPCVVGGSAAAGAAIAGKPVPGGIRDEVGNTQYMGSIAALLGAGDNGRRTLSVGPSLYNGTGFEAAFACTNSAPVSISGSGNTQIVALTSLATIRICNVSWSVSDGSAVAVKLTTGTGSNCGTGTADLTGVYTSPAVALDFGPLAALRGPISTAICANSGTAIAIGGTVVYAKF